MADGLALSYLVFAVRDVGRWRDFAVAQLGCQISDLAGGEDLGLRIDDAAYRILLRQGAQDDLAVLGWSLPSRTALETLSARLRERGAKIRAMTSSDCAARQVEAGIGFTDPLGNASEVVVGLPAAKQAFVSAVMPGGFNTGPSGFGHAVLAANGRLAEMEKFYTDTFGLGVTERLRTKVGPIGIEGVFLHCNRRHHSLAIIAAPSRKRILHFMLEAKELRDVGIAWERAKANGIPLSLELGQHPDPDGTVSFYAATPSGFDFEIGAGGREIDPAAVCSQVNSVTSSWGHKPTLRLQMRGMLDLLASTINRSAA